MKSQYLSMISKNFEVGDTVSIFINNNFVVKGIVYIYGSIPMTKFYYKHHGYNFSDQESDVDTYEDALVVIDNKNASNLIVLTLEENDHKLFVWNDVFKPFNHILEYQKIPDLSGLQIIRESSILTEIKYQFK